MRTTPQRLLAATLAFASLAATAADFSVTSTDVPAGSKLSQKQVAYGDGCKGQNLSPDLSWQNAPAGTRSFAIVVHDPDAPMTGGWWHWIAYNLPPTVTSLKSGAGDYEGKGLPSGVIQGKTSSGSQYWGGACPPSGDKPHRYNFTVYALKVDHLAAKPDDSPQSLSEAIRKQAIASTVITATYGR
ncbi:putative lipoprotein LppC [Andreprevotia sp. IGB-42]|uniref:YbhB/YbcL family Raf kinase inhibitor-like protein n=1 Tax=Andreprevotia sp. IGB-42 TaxID=2497473 RepID=UPI0013590387|nr:YbhB/YbcL family Raf kinase inhibitor-like protein [Andreprevotia sp. IGB-42]KAF0814863.1 putative lipoprotein LppC [Andreprevotia sp. IGB-42]